VSNLTFAEHKMLKMELNTRLKADGVFGKYCRLRQQCIDHGVDPKVAWIVAAYAFPPKRGQIPEITVLKVYEEIAANWKNGRYPPIAEFSTEGMKAGATNFAKLEPLPPEEAAVAKEMIEEVKQAPAKWTSNWAELAERVAALDKVGNELDIIRWVFRNYLVKSDSIDPTTVPDAGAVGLLKHVQENTSNYNDFLNRNWNKLVPDRKQIEQAALYADDGRDLRLLEEFDASLEDMNDEEDEVPLDDGDGETEVVESEDAA
jgi:hypothetical protein